MVLPLYTAMRGLSGYLNVPPLLIYVVNGHQDLVQPPPAAAAIVGLDCYVDVDDKASSPQRRLSIFSPHQSLIQRSISLPPSAPTITITLISIVSVSDIVALLLSLPSFHLRYRSTSLHPPCHPQSDQTKLSLSPIAPSGQVGIFAHSLTHLTAIKSGVSRRRFFALERTEGTALFLARTPSTF